MSEHQMESPLVDQTEARTGRDGPENAGVTLVERSFVGHLMLRGRSDDAAFLSACADVFGIEPPTTPNRFVETKGAVIGWMGPTEWIVLVEQDTRAAWISALKTALANVHGAVVDLSGAETLIGVEGPNAREALAKGCLLDLHPRQATAGFGTRSLLAKSAMYLRVVEAGTRFEVLVRRSFADYLWQWLVDAAGEYGCRIKPAETALVFAGLTTAEDQPSRAVNAS